MSARAPGLAGVVGVAVAAIALGGCGGQAQGSGETVTVFAAASLSEAFAELAEAFEADAPATTVRLSFAGSGTLRTQLLEGAPADVFASASADEVATLAAAGLVIEERALTRNALVVAVAEGAATTVGSLADLARPGLRIALAAEDVPAGRYARRALTRADGAGGLGAGFAARVLANVRSNEASVRAALAKIELGEADAAIVYASDLAGGVAGVGAVAIPERFQAPAEYRIALLAEGAAARAFVAFATSPRGRDILARHGFTSAAVEVAP